LVLLRPKNIQTNFGFSTKLAEYDYSNVPILLTDISDNCMSLKDEKDAFYTTYDPKHIASKINYIYNIDKESRDKATEKARHIATNQFSVYSYSSKLRAFLGLKNKLIN